MFFKKMKTDYFRLYEVDSATNEMLLLAEASYHPSDIPAHYMQVTKGTSPGRSFRPVFEAYFDSARTVSDSFYVSSTSNSNYYRSGWFYEEGYAISGIVTTSPGEQLDNPADRDFCAPKPNHFRRKLHLVDNDNVDERYEITDTNWHVLNKVHSISSLPSSVPWRHYMHIFPIIDTSMVPQCKVPGGLALQYLAGSVATLTWSGVYGADHWELSLCPDGCEPENGVLTQWDNPVATVQGLDTARWYVARVRTACSYGDSSYYSEWSDSLRFYVPGDTAGGGTDPIGFETLDDRYAYLMPNPASETVTVASSFRIAEVEVYTLEGRSVLRQRVDGISTTLDISSLPAATYLVRISTGHGTAFKKLVVK